jgi:cytochrome oxidase Cu insertion factor (SCO1/SenC/PrrC family)
MSRAVLGWLAVLFLAMGATGIWLGAKYASALSGRGGSQAEVDPEYLKAPADASQPWLEEFTLTERSGKKIRSRDLAGQVYVTSFFFSSCPATCLQQNQKIREIEEEYGPKGVKFVSITCDPEIDNPARLREYADKLGARQDDWLFLTGDLVYTRRVAGEIFRIPLDKQTHSERLFVTDKWGTIRGNFAWNKLDQVTAMKAELDKLLAETEKPAEEPAEAQP